jgi:hypothetical protein
MYVIDYQPRRSLLDTREDWDIWKCVLRWIRKPQNALFIVELASGCESKFQMQKELYQCFGKCFFSLWALLGCHVAECVEIEFKFEFEYLKIMCNCASGNASCFCFSLRFAVCGVRGRNQKIVGGSETLPNEYPWVVGLFKQNKLYCGATVISNRYLLTVWLNRLRIFWWKINSRNLSGRSLRQFIFAKWDSGKCFIKLPGL